MSRYARKRDPAVPKVESVELSGKHSKLRLVLTIVFLALAVFFIGYGLISALNRDPGWQEVSVSSGAALRRASSSPRCTRRQPSARMRCSSLRRR